MAPVHPHFTAQFCALCGVMTCGESRINASLHQYIKDVNKINGLLVYDNCYGISCHSKECVKLLHYNTEGVLQCRCSFTTVNVITNLIVTKGDYKYPTPPTVMVIGRAAHGS